MAKAFDDFLVRYGTAVVRWRWLVIVAALLVVAAALSGAAKLSFSTDYRVYFGPTNPQLVAFEEVQNVYTKNDNTLFVVQPPGDTVFNPDTIALMRELTARAWELPYALRVDSITNYQHTEAQADDLLVGDLIGDVESTSAAELIRARDIAINEPLLRSRLISPSGHIAAINIQNQFSGKSNLEVPAAVSATRALRDELIAKYPGHKVYLSGSNMMSNAFGEASQADMATLYPMMYTMLVIIMWLLLRSVSATIATLIIIILSAGGAMGLAGHLGITLTSPSVAAPVVITTLAIADSVHILVTMFASMRDGMDKRPAIIESLRLNFMPVMLTSVTTAIGFLTINFADSPPLADLGNISAMGTMLAWLLSVSLLPALLAVLPLRPPKESRGWLSGRMEAFGRWVVAKQKPVLIGSAAVCIGLVALVPLNEANDVFVEFFDDRIQFRTDSDFMADNITGLYTMEFNLAAPDGVASPEYLAMLDAFKAWWLENPKVMHVASISDIFKRLNKNMHADDESWYRVPQQQDLAAQYLLLYEFSLPFGLDLGNTINIDKTSSRFLVVFEHLSSVETRALARAGHEWLVANAPASKAHGVSPAVMFAFISERNFTSMAYGIPLALIGISLLLIFALRSTRIGLLSMVPNLFPLGMAFGLWALYSGQVNFTMAFSLGMVLGVIVDDTIHFLSKYLRARREQGLSTEEAIVYSFRTVGTALTVTSIILVGGFLILSTSAFLPNESMSLVTVMAIISALAADFFLLPTLLLRFDRDSPSKEHDSKDITNEPAYA